MAEVTVKATQTFGGIRVGEVVTIQRTDYVEKKIASGRLVVVEDDEVAGDTFRDGAGEIVHTDPVDPELPDDDDVVLGDDDDDEFGDAG